MDEVRKNLDSLHTALLVMFLILMAMLAGVFHLGGRTLDRLDRAQQSVSEANRKLDLLINAARANGLMDGEEGK